MSVEMNDEHYQAPVAIAHHHVEPSKLASHRFVAYKAFLSGRD